MNEEAAAMGCSVVPLGAPTTRAKAAVLARPPATRSSSKGPQSRPPVARPARRAGGANVTPQKHPRKKGVAIDTNPLVPLLSSGSEEVQVVALGKRLEGQMHIHGREIPEGYVAVQISFVVKGKYPLPIPNRSDDPPQLCVEDVNGSTTVWPSSCIGPAMGT
jgi:hypothetical protein